MSSIIEEYTRLSASIVLQLVKLDAIINQFRDQQPLKQCKITIDGNVLMTNIIVSKNDQDIDLSRCDNDCVKYILASIDREKFPHVPTGCDHKMLLTWAELTTHSDVSEHFIKMAEPSIVNFVTKRYPKTTDFMLGKNVDVMRICEELVYCDASIGRIITGMFKQDCSYDMIQNIIRLGIPAFGLLKAE